MNKTFILLACLLLTLSSCNRKSVTIADPYQQGDETSRKNKAIADLNEIISDSGIHWKVKTKMLDRIREQFFENDQLDDLISEASKKIKADRKLADAKEEEGYFADLKKSPASNTSSTSNNSRSTSITSRPTPEKSRPFASVNREGIEGKFDAIAAAADQYEAQDQAIETLTLFANPSVPVLLIISKEGEDVEYGKPLTIKAYLEYLRDTKKSAHKVASLEKDTNGRISVIELSNY